MKRYLAIVLLLVGFRGFATHIVGGEIIYDYLGNDKYRITLKVYRDCLKGTSELDGIGPGLTGLPAVLTIMETLNSANAFTIDVGIPVITKIPPTINNPCIQTPTDVCVQEGVYTKTVTLPPTAGGYQLIYQRCCRNNSILNLLTSGSQGSTYYTKIPGPEEVIVNSSPRFKNFPPIFLCNELAFQFDHSAVDPDGDQLVYSLCAPYHGLDGCCPSIGIGGVPFPSVSCPSPPGACPVVASPPPFPLVTYISPYDGAYPIASNPAVTINPVTGLLAGTPNLIGQFVVGVCVQEFRNGNLIGTHFRDFQFNIVGCVVLVESAVADQESKCLGATITFTNRSTSNMGALVYHWDFGVPNIASDTSNQVNTTYTYQDTGVYILTLITNPGKPCSDTLKKEVYVYPPLDIKFIPPPQQCIQNNSFNFNATGVYAAQATFTWDFSSFATPSVSTQKDPAQIVFSKSGYVPIKLLSRQFSVCRDSMIDSIRIIGRPQAMIGGLPKEACEPATVYIRNDSRSDLPLVYSWYFSNGINSIEFAPRLTFKAGVYNVRLVVATTSVCVDTSLTQSPNFTVNPKPDAGFSCIPATTSIFEPEISFYNRASYDAMYWRYEFGDESGSRIGSPVHSYTAFGEYEVIQIVTNRFGCADTASLKVVIEPEFRFWMPNTFTPDGNNVNDVFRPSIFGVEDYEFEIFDEWGASMFKTSDLLGGWDGKKKEKECPEDVYVWRIVFKNQVSRKVEERCGHVMLLRNY